MFGMLRRATVRGSGMPFKNLPSIPVQNGAAEQFTTESIEIDNQCPIHRVIATEIENETAKRQGETDLAFKIIILLYLH